MSKSEELNSRYYCTFPFENVEINFDKKLYFCCSVWQNKPFGDFENHSVKDVWNSDEAQEIRASIIDGSFKYCKKNLCPYLHSKTLKTFNELTEDQQKYFTENKTILDTPPKQMMLNYDKSCNLTCESCRVEKISYNVDSKEFSVLKYLTDKFTRDFFSLASNSVMRLNITGSGDPFASAVFRQFLENLDGEKFPNLVIDLQTNGVLFTPIVWERLNKIHKNIGQVVVSVDAASEETYVVVRRGGNWKQLMQNLEFLSELRVQNKIGMLQVNMVVQKRNFFEMKKFVEIFNKDGIDSIYFSLIANWFTWPENEFNQHAIWQKTNREHGRFIELLADPIFKNEKIHLGNLTELRQEAVQVAYSKLSTFVRMKIRSRILIKKYYFKSFNFIVLIKKIICREKKLFN
jgi:molybdenum cofactor biosynthesis enzyme MoaA